MMRVQLPDFEFTFKPLLIGGAAMEHWNLRTAGADVDFVVSRDDHARLVAAFPDDVKDIYGDIGVCVGPFEIWNSICRFDYTYLSHGAVDVGEYLVASLEKLLFMKSLVKDDAKSQQDVRLIVDELLRLAYRSEEV